MLNTLIGFLSGIISGMGIGGGAILIPALVFTQNLAQQTAQGINLTYFIPTAVIALVVHIKSGNVDLKTAFIIGAYGVLGAAAGSAAALVISGDVLKRIFGIFLLLIGISEIRKGIKMPS